MKLQPQDEESVLHIDNRSKLRAISSPLRRLFVDALSTLGQASVREVAEVVGKPAATLYYHLRALEEAGFVREVGERPTGKRPEKVYALVSNQFISEGGHDAAYRSELGRHIHDNLRALERSLLSYIEDPRFGSDGVAPRLQFRVSRIHIGDQELAELAARLKELTQFLCDAEQRAQKSTPATEFLFTYVPAVPPSASLERKPRPRRPSDDTSS
jgi:DNA-binding transcriptional ArsR family regulator